MKSIITNKKVDKTFRGEECRLLRTITSKITKSGHTIYNTKIEYCNYETVTLEVIEEGEIVENQADKLVILGLKDREISTKYSENEVNSIYELIREDIDDSLNKTQKENLEDCLGLLFITRQEEPYGTNSDDWDLLI